MENQSVDSAVYVYKLEDSSSSLPEDMARGGYEFMKALSLPLKDKVVMKPNITVPADPDSGIVTHPDFIAGMSQYFLEQGMSGDNVMVAEGGGSDKMDGHYGQSGYIAMAKSRGVKLVNLNWDESVPVELPDGVMLKKIGIAKTVKSDDAFFINVPKYKTHNLAVTTLSMKNLMGTITPCHERHLCSTPREFAERHSEITPNGIELREEILCQRLCDLSMASKPDFNIIEGIIGRDGTAFHHGKNIRTNLVIAGKSTVAVDTVGSYLMGLEPSEIGYLKLAAKRGLGLIDMKKIKIMEVCDGKIVPCDDISKFLSPIPFEVLRHDKQPRNIPLNKDMLAKLRK